MMSLSLNFYCMDVPADTPIEKLLPLNDILIYRQRVQYNGLFLRDYPINKLIAKITMLKPSSQNCAQPCAGRELLSDTNDDVAVLLSTPFGDGLDFDDVCLCVCLCV